jgi:hypothetical protein
VQCWPCPVIRSSSWPCRTHNQFLNPGSRRRSWKLPGDRNCSEDITRAPVRRSLLVEARRSRGTEGLSPPNELMEQLRCRADCLRDRPVTLRIWLDGNGSPFRRRQQARRLRLPGPGHPPVRHLPSRRGPQPPRQSPAQERHVPGRVRRPVRPRVQPDRPGWWRLQGERPLTHPGVGGIAYSRNDS